MATLPLSYELFQSVPAGRGDIFLAVEVVAEPLHQCLT